MKATEFVKEFVRGYASGKGKYRLRIYVTDSGSIKARYDIKSGWCAPYYASEDDMREVVKDMKEWIEQASGKPLWQAMRDGVSK